MTAEMRRAKLAKLIEIEGFIDAGEVHPTLYESPYFAGPDGAVASKTYSLLTQALKASFDWYRAMAKDAEHNARRTDIGSPILYLRGDAGPASTAPPQASRQAERQRRQTDREPAQGEPVRASRQPPDCEN